LAAALADAGHDVAGVLGRADDVTDAARGVDVLIIAAPDAQVAAVASAVAPQDSTVVLHLSGALGLDVLAPHPRRASLHPLVPLPSAEVGRVRLRSGVTFAVSGDDVAGELARSLGGQVIEVDDEQRAAYHAAACIAANHVVALMGQVERVATAAGLGLDPFVGLAAAALTDVGDLGPARALTGPAARGDDGTIARHRAVLAAAELPGYDAGVALATRLADDRAASERIHAPTGRALASRSHGAVSGRGQRATVPAPTRRRRDVEVVTTGAEFAAALDRARATGRDVGLVPTMGALHAGHRALVERAAAECDVVAVTVFVNPLQFGDAADLARYPRDLDGDVAIARAAGASIVFAPSVEEMYPGYPKPVATTVHVDGVSEGLEGASRPGHFDGVATVVAKLFALAGRCRAYFGEKDFQQLAVVRRLAADLSLAVDVVACPTVREPDGLALSSRNARLSPDERRAALALHRALDAGRRAVDAGERDAGRVRAAMWAELDAEPLVVPDYGEVVEPATLRPLGSLDGEARLLVAATVGSVRLIDNMPVTAVTRTGTHTGTHTGTRTGTTNLGDVVPVTIADALASATRKEH